MPIEISTPSRIVSDLYKPVAIDINKGKQEFLDVVRANQGQFDTEQLQLVIQTFQKKIERQFPDVNPEQIQRTIRFMFGILSVSPINRDEEITYEERTLIYVQNAAAQHEFVHHLMLATTKQPDKQFMLPIYRLLAETRLLHSTMKNELNNRFSQWLAGVRNEAAVIRYLTNGLQYKVYLPDYDNTSLDGEVASLDVKKSIDLVAVTPEGEILLIDVTTQDVQMSEDPFLVTDKKKITFPANAPLSSTDANFLDIIAKATTNPEKGISDDYTLRPVIHMRIALPTSQYVTYVDPIKAEKSGEDKEQYIQQWITFKHYIPGKIKRGIRHILRHPDTIDTPFNNLVRKADRNNTIT